MHGCGTWSPTLREERGLRVFEIRVLRRIFGPKRDEVIGVWRELHNEYSLLNIIRVIKSRRMGLAGHVARMGERRGAYRILVGKPESKRQLGRPGSRLENYIMMNLEEDGWGAMAWIDVAQDRDRRRALVNAAITLRVL